MSPEDPKPRKVIIGTMCHAMWGPYPGLLARCEELNALIDRMAAESDRRYGRGPDLIVLPEFALNDMAKPLEAKAVSVFSEGFNYFRDPARHIGAYIVVPAVTRVGEAHHNSAVLLDREGRIAGRYDKVHVCPDEPPACTFEGGLTPGRDYPVFDCDFGTLGIQICLDYGFEEGWRELKRQGTELVVWPTQSPSVAIASARAVNNRLYIVSSTWRNNASIIEPIGTVAAQIAPPEEVLVHEIDLEHRLVGWGPKLRDGAAFQEEFGDRVGFNYYPREDVGVFWSNDPSTPIDAMIRRLGVWTYDEYLAAQTERLTRLRDTRREEDASAEVDPSARWRAERQNMDPLVRAVDMTIGEERTVRLCDGSEATVKLAAIDERRDSVRDAVRSAEIAVEVNGVAATIIAAPYRLPVGVGGVQIDCTITRGNQSNSGGNPWAMDADARLRLWPAGSPWIRPGSLRYPLRDRWFAGGTQMANEPSFVDGGEQPGVRRIYYHPALDFGGADYLTEVVAIADAIVVAVGEYALRGHEMRTPGPCPGRVNLLDRRGWLWRHHHMASIRPEIQPGAVVEAGQPLGTLGKEGASGGYVDLHLALRRDLPSGRPGEDNAYAFVHQAYIEEHRPAVLAVARPHHVLWTGETALLDARLSFSASGEIASYEWTFSDGETATGPAVRRTYPQAGRYSEIIKVTDPAGHAAWDFAVVDVLDRQGGEDQRPPAIDAAFWPTRDIRPGRPVTFKSRTFGADPGEEVWDFGDGAPTVAIRSDGNAFPWGHPGYASTEHAYAEAGDYIVTVRTTDGGGTTATVRLWVRVENS